MAVARSDFLDAVNLVKGCLIQIPSPVHLTPATGQVKTVACGQLTVGIRASEETPGQGIPRQDGHAERLARRHDFVLDCPVQQVVALLDRRKRGQAQSPAGPVSLGKLPRLQVARADVPDLPGVNQVIKCAECLRKGHVRVERVGLIKVNVVGLEASQARLARPDNVISPETGIV